MDFMKILVDLIASVETALLIFALIHATKAIMEKADAIVKRGYFQKTFVYLAAFLVLKVLRMVIF